MESSAQSGDPRLRVLTIRARAAEEELAAAKIYCRVTKLEATAARLILHKLGHDERALELTSRGQRFYNRMKEHEATLSKKKEMKDILEQEILRMRDKALKLSAQAAAQEKKSKHSEDSARLALSEAEKLKRERDKLLIEAKKLEAEAVRIESLI